MYEIEGWDKLIESIYTEKNREEKMNFIYETFTNGHGRVSIPFKISWYAFDWTGVGGEFKKRTQLFFYAGC